MKGRQNGQSAKRKRLLSLFKILLAFAILVVILATAKVRDHLVLPEGTPFAGAHPGWIEEEEGRIRFVKESEFLFEAGYTDGKIRTATLAGADGRMHAFSPADIEKIQIRWGIASVVKKIDFRLWALSMVIYFIGISLTAGRWWMLLKASDLPQTLVRAFRLTYIGIFFNNVVPGQTGGDLVRAYYIARENQGRRTDSILTVLVDRILGITALAFIGAAIIPSDFELYGRDNAVLIYGFIGVMIVGSCLFFSKRLRRFFRLDRLLRILPFQDFFQKIDKSIFLYRYKKKGLLACFLVSFVIHLILIVSIWVLGEGLRITLPLTAYIAYIPIIFIISSLPLTPAGWGVGEACFAYFFHQIAGAPLAPAVALSLVFRVNATLLSLVGGLFLLMERERIRTVRIDFDKGAEEKGLS